MTPKERAEQVTSKLYDHGCKTDNQAMLADLSCADCAMEVQQAIESVIVAAVLSEREQCAEIAETDSVLDWVGGSTGNAKGTALRIAAVIRARGE